MQDFKSRSFRQSAWIVFIVCGAACNAILDNHPRELQIVTAGAGGGMVAPGASGDNGLGGNDESAGEVGASGAAGSGHESPEGGAAGSEHVPVGGGAGSPTGGTAGVSQGGTSPGGASPGGTSPGGTSPGSTSPGGNSGCTGCTPGITEAQSRSCGLCNAGKESGTRKCTSSCTWETTWSGSCSDQGDPDNGCSRVKWCTNSNNRTECALIGCTAKQAEDECRKEAPVVCGTVKNLLMTTQCP